MTSEKIVPIRPAGSARIDADSTTLLCDYCEDGRAVMLYENDRPDLMQGGEWHTLCSPCADVRIAHVKHYCATDVEYYDEKDFIVEDSVLLIDDLRRRLLNGDGVKDAWLWSWLGQQGLQAVLEFEGSWESSQ